jgi:hypothetical protein
MRRFLLSVAALFLVSGTVQADIITQWNFNSSIPDANVGTGVVVPNIGSGTASLFGGTTATFASGDASGGSTDPATGDDSGWNITSFAAPGGTARGVEFAVSTSGKVGITVSWDQRHSNTASRGVEFFYSTNGTTFTSFGTVANATAGDTWFNNRSIDLTSITGVENNPNFAFRILQRVTSGTNPSDYEASNTTSTYASTGTWRFDMVTVSAVPEPSSGILLGAIGLAMASYRRFLRRNRAA